MTTTDGVPAAPPGARFDPVTGAELTGAAGGERRRSYALQPGEPVASFNLVSSLLPLASGTSPQTYRWALALGVLVPVVAGALGFLAFAFVAAAVVVPAVYVVYLYDVNQWEDQPLAVVLGAVAAAAALGVGFTFLWHAGILGGDLAPVDFGDTGTGGVRWSSLLVLVLLVPVVSEVLKQVGPLVLASRPRFDDMIDGLTFGVASGAAFAAAETIVVNRALFSSFGHVDSPDAGFWVSLILSAAVVKPVVYGAATGIAVASFSGLGAGYDGFRPGYFRGLFEAVAANVLFQGGLFLAARLEGTTGAVVGLVWGAVVAVALVVRLRHLLHFAVLEAALVAATDGVELRDTAHGAAYCPSCELPLLHGANFCVGCGTSVRAGSKVTRARNRAEVPAPERPRLAATPLGTAPRDTRTTAVVLAAVAATVLLAGAAGQAAAAAAGDGSGPSVPRVELDTVPGQGPTTDPAPEPANPPGPTPDPSEGASPSGEASQGAAPSPALDLGDTSAAYALDGGGLDTTDGPQDGGAGDTGGPVSGTGDTVELGGGYGFELPAGYEVEAQGDGFARVWGDGGYFWALLTPAPADVETMVTDHLDALQGMGIQDLAISEPEALDLATSSIVQCVFLGYQGVLATQQGGTLPVEGFAYYFVTQDGTGVTAFGLYEQGVLTEDNPLANGYSTMLNTLVASF